jgi:site-specific DNA-methyltransferase (adenine-specific)
MGNVVHLLDNMVGMDGTPDKYYDLAVVDPEYGIGYSSLVGVKKESDGWKSRKAKEWDNVPPPPEYFTELFRVSKNQIIFGGNYFDLPPTRCFLIWDKVQRIDQADCELAWTSFSSSARIFTYARGNDSGFAPKLKGDDKKWANMHPTQKPVALYDWIYKNYLPNGGKVLDTHIGSGSSRISAYKRGNVDFTGYEIDPDYWNDQDARFREFVMKNAPASIEPVTKYGQFKMF